jgi:hypothetical protein
LQANLNLDGTDAEFKAVFAEAVTEQFDTEGARSGERWRDLVRATILARLRRGHQAGPILNETGQLKREAANPTVEASGSKATVMIQDSRGLVGIHSNPKPGSKLPQRVVYSPTDADADRVANVVVDKLFGGL